MQVFSPLSNMSARPVEQRGALARVGHVEKAPVLGDLLRAAEEAEPKLAHLGHAARIEHQQRPACLGLDRHEEAPRAAAGGWAAAGGGPTGAGGGTGPPANSPGRPGRLVARNKLKAGQRELLNAPVTSVAHVEVGAVRRGGVDDFAVSRLVPVPEGASPRMVGQADYVDGPSPRMCVPQANHHLAILQGRGAQRLLQLRDAPRRVVEDFPRRLQRHRRVVQELAHA